MLNYFFTTLAINEPYFSNSLNFFASLHEKTEKSFFNITTTKNDLETIEIHTGLNLDEFKKKYPKILISVIEDLNKNFTYPLDMEGKGLIFNYNLKVLSIKAVLESNIDFDYLIFTDGDWNVYEEFEELKIFNLFKFMEENQIDFVFERPAKIGGFKENNYENCFFYEKLVDYGADKHDLWDEAHVVNEQFMVFKNNIKLNIFQQKWEQMLWYTIANNIRNYADGFEIGVSSLEAKMKYNFDALKILKNCFYFYPKYLKNKHIRF